MIVTCKKQIPFYWIAFTVLPLACLNFNGNTLFLFSLKKFVDNPAGVTLILSLPTLLSLLVQPIVSFMSDRIWTRIGRRKPFVLFSFAGMATCVLLLPLMPNFWGLLGFYLVGYFFAAFSGPLEPLKFEIVPPHERGRAAGTMTWFTNLATLTFFFVAFGRFDDVVYMYGVPLRGETIMYWFGGLLLVVMLLFIALGIKELDQKSALVGQHLSLKTFFGGLIDRELWPVYMLIVGAACLNFYAGLGPLNNLLYTEQWGYTKQEMGINVAVGGVLNLFLIGILTFFADKLNRMRAYQILICLSLFVQFTYYCYVNFLLPDKRPSLVEIIVFGETLSIISTLTGLVFTPLIYDYIRRNKMGTFHAGSQVVNRLTTLVTLNGVGLFVWLYASAFLPPAGEMARVVLKDDQTSQSQLLESLRTASWLYPGSGKPAPSSDISLSPWQADGVSSAHGRGWEVRFRDPDSEQLTAQKDSLVASNSPLLAEERMRQDKIAKLQLNGTDSSHEKELADALQSQINSNNRKTEQLAKELKDRSENFRHQVEQVLADRLMKEGDEVLQSTSQPALLLDIHAAYRPTLEALAKMIHDLRMGNPSVIDVRPAKFSDGYGLTASTLLDPTVDASAVSTHLEQALVEAGSKHSPGLFPPGQPHPVTRKASAIKLTVSILESPAPSYVSPIMHISNAISDLFSQWHSPYRRIDAIGSNLRLQSGLEHVNVEPDVASRTLVVTAILPDHGTTEQLKEVPQSGDSTQWLLRQIDAAAATQRFTIAHPLIASGYAGLKYDYTSGYLWMFFMASIGILITFVFQAVERRGLIQKRGIEEERGA